MFEKIYLVNNVIAPNMNVFSMFVIVKDGTNFMAINGEFQILKIPNLRKKMVAELL